MASQPVNTASGLLDPGVVTENSNATNIYWSTFSFTYRLLHFHGRLDPTCTWFSTKPQWSWLDIYDSLNTFKRLLRLVDLNVNICPLPVHSDCPSWVANQYQTWGRISELTGIVRLQLFVVPKANIFSNTMRLVTTDKLGSYTRCHSDVITSARTHKPLPKSIMTG